jgi:type I restriction enzyme M protein
MELLEQGIEKGLIKFDSEQRFITYVHQNKKRSWSNPEEHIQAETFLKLVLVYNYPENRIRHYTSVTMGSSTREADLIVYNDDDCMEPYIIVECKKEDVSEQEFMQAVEQAFSYAYATPKNIKFIWVTSGIKDVYFEFNKEKNIRKDAPDIPGYGVDELAKYKYVKGGSFIAEDDGGQPAYGRQKFFELEKVTEEELTRRFKQAHNSLWAGGEMNPSQAFDELDKLIFCKIWDETYTIDEKSKKFRPRKNGEPYLFQTFANETEKELAKRAKDIYEQGRAKDPEVFSDDIRLTPQKIKTVVGYLEGINLSKTDLDSKGRAFEAFMGSYFRGDFGQYFTPRPIVKFIVDALPITNDSRVLDTSCGSGGFLLYALDKVRAQATEYYDEGGVEHYKYWHDFAQFNLYGIEINEGIARTAKMNMIIHDDGHTNVIAADGLLKSEKLIEKSGNTGFKENSFNFIITNPPFGSSIKQTEKAYLHQYNFGLKEADWLDTKNSAVKKRPTQSTEVLFIEQCRNFLKPGGYLAIVIPDGILTNSSLQDIRDQLEEWYRIVAVVSMPQTAFMHTGAGVKSSVLFLRKLSDKQSESVANTKKVLQEKIKTENDYLDKVDALDQEKKDIIKNHTGFEPVRPAGGNTTGESDKKAIEKTDAFIEWKTLISAVYSQKINELKEELADQYIERKQQELADYPIFMAIAEDIGYDATGRLTGNNELEIIGWELKRFVEYIEKKEKV